MDTNISKRFDDWLKSDSSAAALVMRQWLLPVEGENTVIFPPTYAEPNEMSENEKREWRQQTLGYNIDRLDGGATVCQIDSVGAQANRMEAIFKREPYKKLVPQVTITVGQTKVNLLDAGHRAADGVVRFSSLRGKFDAAFCSIKDNGDAEPLAKIAPTSIVFGCWDSQSTGVKLPRIVRSVIRAYEVDLLHRSAQYIAPVRYVNAGVIEVPEGVSDRILSKLGLRDTPASWTHGGVKLRPEKGEIRRDAVLNLAAIRALGTNEAGPDDEKTLKLRRYILGLALVAFTAPHDTNLREGCQLVPDAKRPSKWELVRHDGQREEFSLSHDEALKFAEDAAHDFVIGPDEDADFDQRYAKQQLAKSKEERKKEKRQRKLETNEEEQK